MAKVKSKSTQRLRVSRRGFEEAYEQCWLDLSEMRALKTRTSERLKKELFFIWEVGRNGAKQPPREQRLLQCLHSMLAAEKSLSQLLTNLHKLTHLYRMDDFDTTVRMHPLYGALDERPKLNEFIFELRLAGQGLEALREIFGLMAGLSVEVPADLRPRRKVFTNPLLQTVHVAMKSWCNLTSSNVSFAKGISGFSHNGSQNRVFKSRPLQDDAYFILICLHLVFGLTKPSTAITAINRARKQKARFDAACKSNSAKSQKYAAMVAKLDAEDDLMRRTKYGLEY